MNGAYGPRSNLRYEIPPYGLRDRRSPLLNRIPVANAHGYARTNGFGPGPVVPVPLAVGRYGDSVLQLPYGYPISTSGVSLLPANLNANNQLSPLNRTRGLGLSGTDVLAVDSDTWRPNNIPCSANSSSCQSARSATYAYDTKDIVIRGKAKVIRKSYLHESPKFEADLIKYLDKKSEEQIPERVVDLLITFINQNFYENFSVIDEVTLNILAYNVGAKSVGDYSLTRLKKDVKNSTSFASWTELGNVTATILMCTKVDGGLTGWLKKILGADQNTAAITLVNSCREFMVLVDERPEVQVEIERLLGLKAAPKDDKYRSL